MFSPDDRVSQPHDTHVIEYPPWTTPEGFYAILIRLPISTTTLLRVLDKAAGLRFKRPHRSKIYKFGRAAFLLLYYKDKLAGWLAPKQATKTRRLSFYLNFL